MKDDNDKWVALGLAATTTDTLWEKLTKPGKGFKFDGQDQFSGVPAMKFLDEAMKKRYGGHLANKEWTEDNRKLVIKDLIEELSDKITGDAHYLDGEDETQSAEVSAAAESCQASNEDSGSDVEVHTTSKRKRARIESDSDEEYDE